VSSAPIPLWRRLLAEFLGSAFLAAIVIGSGIAAQRLSPGQTGLELAENAAVTAAGLFAIILMFGPVSGGHFNPVVSFADAAFGGLSWRDAAAYLPAQVAGCIGGAVLANLMFALPAVTISARHRATPAHFLSEIIATAGLLLVIFSLARSRPRRVRPGRGGRLYRRGVLVHLLHQLRQPGHHHRPDVLRHLRRDRPVLGPELHRRPDRGRRPGRGGHQGAVSRRLASRRR
jgi:glycerol uptake facilitator-like aquaporin